MTLRVERLSVAYRGVTAVQDVSLSVEPGACVAVIGANGAGKTSLFRGIGGLVRTGRDTRVYLDDHSLHRMGAARRIRSGLGHVLENRHVFPGLTVEQNLELGRAAVSSGHDVEYAYELFPALRELARTPASSLSGGQQQFLAIARALMAAPKVVMMDEPSMGLAPKLVDSVIEIIRTLTAAGIPVLLSEQELRVVAATATDVHVLVHGAIVQSLAGDDPALEATAHKAYLA